MGATLPDDLEVVHMARILLAAVLCALIALTGCTSVWVSPLGNDSNAGTQTSPKRSFAGACAVPKDSQGRFVLVAPGVYGLQTVPASCDRTMFVADGGTVTVRNNQGNGLQPTLQNDARNVEFVGINIDSAFAVRQGFGNSGVARFRDAAIGNVTDEKGLLSGSEPGSEYRNVLFHDVRAVSPDAHLECMYSQTPAVRVIDSTFRDCAFTDIFFTYGSWWGQPIYGDGVIEGNRFFHANRGAANDWHYNNVTWNADLAPFTGWRVRNNWVETRATGDSVSPATGGFGYTGPASWASSSVRCGNTETAGVDKLGSEWTSPC